MMASQVACLRRASLNSLPTSVSVTTSLLALAVDVFRNAEEEYASASASQENEIWKLLMNGGRVTPRHLGVVLAGVSKENQFSP